MAKFSELTIENFRGAARELNLRFNGEKLAVIFGENGTGKTTIVDAMDLIGNGHVGSITEKSSVNISRHAPSLGRSVSDIMVIARQDSQTWTGSLTSKGVSVTPQPCLPVRVLRRGNLQRFIDAQPAARYLEIKHLIGVESIEAAEKTLVAAATQANNQADQFARDRTTAGELIANLWEVAGRPGSSAEGWAQEQIATLAETSIARDAALTTMLNALRRLQVRHEEYLANKLVGEQAADALQQFEQESLHGSITIQPGDLEILSVLRAATASLEAHNEVGTCPVCQQPVDVNTLRADLDHRLSDLEALNIWNTQRSGLSSRSTTATLQLAQAEARLLESATQLQAIAAGDLYGANLLAETIAFNIETVRGGVQLAELAEGLLLKIETQQKLAAEQRGQVQALQKAQSSIDAYTAQTANATTLAATLQQAAELVQRERHDFTQYLLNSLSEEANTLYQALHPDEGLVIDRLELDPKKRASVNQIVAFAGHGNLPPQAYYSEAHLDTLGFCFWLANVKLHAGSAKPIVVIDDVFSSADANHLGRIAQLLKDQSANVGHIILTTHNGHFREHLKKVGSVQLLELDHRWSLASGIRVHDGRLPVDDLRAALEGYPFDRQAVASKAGILLEELLDTIALQYRVKMARITPPTYTLGELLSDTKSTINGLRVVNPDGSERIPPVTIRNQIQAHDFIRNQVGAHFNLQGLEVSSHDVEQFGRQTVTLYELLTCGGCGRIPYDWNGSGHSCRCKPKPTTMTLTTKK